MHDLDKLDWEILNVTADDCENLEQIYLGVCFEVVPGGEGGGPFDCTYRRIRGTPGLSEVADRVRSLVGKGLLDSVGPSGIDPSHVWQAWFSMTSEGRRAWDESEFANFVEHKGSS